jgi:hypothetical protein
MTDKETENQVCFKKWIKIHPFTASCENAMSLSVPGVTAPCEKFPHSSQLNFE